MLAAALIDREMLNAQYEPDRIRAEDVQNLLRTVDVEEDERFTDRFEAGEMPARIVVTLEDGTVHDVEKADFEGHPNNSMSWEQVEGKFHDMTEAHFQTGRRKDLAETVHGIEAHDVEDLTALLA
jgi:2-methylcitrate dehydratase